MTRFSCALRRIALSSVLSASLLAVAPTSFAQAAPAADDALFQAFGAMPGLAKLMDDFMVRLLADPRMGPFFKDSDQAHVKAELVDQFCEVSGGPCKYTGKSMAKAHEALDVNKGAFNALVEVLQQTMDADGIAFSAQNQMLARLAPMHREIVNVP